MFDMNNNNTKDFQQNMYDEPDAPPAKVANMSNKYNLIYENGHRKYGPPTNFVGEIPSRGCEVFIGKIPKDCFENELIPLFESCGPIYEFRLMMDGNTINRGFGFCVYQTKEGSQLAVEKLNDYEIKPGKHLGVCFSVDNCRLFVGGIPKTKSKEEILVEMQRVTSGVVNVIAYPSIANKNKNRGFAFVEYETHKAAAVARRKLMPGKIPLWGQQIAVDWAEPEREVCESIMANVKILYARNLMLTTTEETLREKFLEASGGPPSCIERVKKMKDYAFIHFIDRVYAENAKNKMNDSELEGSIIEVSWAKPADKTQAKPNKLQPNLSELSLGDLQAQTEYYLDGKTGICYLGPALNNWAGLITDNSIRPKQVRRNAAGTRSISLQRDKRTSIELLEELSLAMNWGIPQYSTSSIDFDRSGNRNLLYSAEVYLPNVNIKQATQSLHSTPDEAKLAVAELLYKLLKQPQNAFNGFDMRLAGFQPFPIATTHLTSPTAAANLTSAALSQPVAGTPANPAMDSFSAFIYYQSVAAALANSQAHQNNGSTNNSSINNNNGNNNAGTNLLGPSASQMSSAVGLNDSNAMNQLLHANVAAAAAHNNFYTNPALTQFQSTFPTSNMGAAGCTLAGLYNSPAAQLISLTTTPQQQLMDQSSQQPVSLANQPPAALSTGSNNIHHQSQISDPNIAAAMLLQHSNTHNHLDPDYNGHLLATSNITNTNTSINPIIGANNPSIHPHNI